MNWENIVLFDIKLLHTLFNIRSFCAHEKINIAKPRLVPTLAIRQANGCSISCLVVFVKQKTLRFTGRKVATL